MKASLYPPQGEIFNNYNNLNVANKDIGRKDVSVMDQDYIVVSGHVEQALQDKIVTGQYIDFAKLFPKDRVMSLDDSNMELTVHDGKAFCSLVAEGVAIPNFSKWEQAFHVYANIYAKVNPDCTSELIEYNHIIHSVSLTFAWDNIYAYDRDFRLHIARHPDRSWVIILQEVWAKRLCNRIVPYKGSNDTSGHDYAPSSHQAKGGKSSDYCKRYNKGNATWVRDAGTSTTAPTVTNLAMV